MSTNAPRKDLHHGDDHSHNLMQMLNNYSHTKTSSIDFSDVPIDNDDPLRFRSAMNILLSRIGLIVLSFFALTTYSYATEYPASAYKDAAKKCINARDLKCAEINWTQYVKMRPNDSDAKANLAIISNWRDKPENAISMAEQAIQMGEGSYDLFAAYSESLNKVGRNDEAIDWGYKALEITPHLANIRGMVAKLLTQQKREIEALTLLASYDSYLESIGRTPFFLGQRISIESVLEQRGETAVDKKGSLRLPKFRNHFFAPIKLGDAPIQAFIVDTGATKTSIPEALLIKANIKFKVVKEGIPAKIADNSIVWEKLVKIDRMKIGPFELKNVSVIACRSCPMLLGQTELSRFNISSNKKQGIEFLNLQLR